MNRGHFRTPNPPVYRASTVLFESSSELSSLAEAFGTGDPDISLYGTHGTPTIKALQDALLEGEGGAGVALTPNGLSAIVTAFLTVVKAGDHILVTDSTYDPAREFCNKVLSRLGVETEYYDPLIGGEIAQRIRPNTTLIWTESPGSRTFEIQDLPAIVAAARAADHRVVTAIDNTYGSPGLLAPFDLGLDLSVVALTKYWGGHSDVLMGAVFANAELWPEVRQAASWLGMGTNGDEAYLCLRGARTVKLRMAAHQEAGLEIARRLSGHPRVGAVLHPGLPGAPGHDLFTRDFTGSNGLFSFELRKPSGEPGDVAEAWQLCDRLAARGRFGIGYSWGGYESLATVSDGVRVVRPWTGGALIRLHIGLEPVEELWADLQAALA